MPALVGGSGAAGTPLVSIIPWARSDGTLVLPVTTDLSGSVRALTNSEFLTAVASGARSAHLKVDFATITNPATVNSLTVVPNGGSGISGSGTLTVSSGGVFVQPALNTPPGTAILTQISAPLNFGAAEGILHTPSSTSVEGELRLSGRISGSGGLIRRLVDLLLRRRRSIEIADRI